MRARSLNSDRSRQQITACKTLPQPDKPVSLGSNQKADLSMYEMSKYREYFIFIN